MATKVILKNKKTPLIKDVVRKQLNKKWSNHMEVDDAVYGHDGMRAVRRLRESGINVVKRYNKNTGLYEYRIAR